MSVILGRVESFDIIQASEGVNETSNSWVRFCAPRRSVYISTGFHYNIAVSASLLSTP